LASIQIVSSLVLMASATAMPAPMDHCRPDIQKFCTGGAAGGGARDCLKAHGIQVSPACQGAPADTKARHNTQSSN
jgi:hypothetical protein